MKREIDVLFTDIEKASRGDEIRIQSFVGLCNGLVELEQLVQKAEGKGVRLVSEEESWMDIEYWKSDFDLVMRLYHEYKRRYGAQAVSKAISQGRRPGRSTGIAHKTDLAMKKAVAILKKEPQCSISKVCKRVGLSTNTFNKYRFSYEQE